MHDAAVSVTVFSVILNFLADFDDYLFSLLTQAHRYPLCHFLSKYVVYVIHISGETALAFYWLERRDMANTPSRPRYRCTVNQLQVRNTVGLYTFAKLAMLGDPRLDSTQPVLTILLCSLVFHIVPDVPGISVVQSTEPVSYTHLTLPTIYSV